MGVINEWGGRGGVVIEQLTRPPLSLRLRFRQLPGLGEPVRAVDEHRGFRLSYLRS